MCICDWSFFNGYFFSVEVLARTRIICTFNCTIYRLSSCMLDCRASVKRRWSSLASMSLGNRYPFFLPCTITWEVFRPTIRDRYVGIVVHCSVRVVARINAPMACEPARERAREGPVLPGKFCMPKKWRIYNENLFHFLSMSWTINLSRLSICLHWYRYVVNNIGNFLHYWVSPLCILLRFRSTFFLIYSVTHIMATRHHRRIGCKLQSIYKKSAESGKAI